MGLPGANRVSASRRFAPWRLLRRALKKRARSGVGCCRFNRMKGLLIAFLVIALGSLDGVSGVTPPSDVLPNAWPPNRFESLIQKSPFAPATPTAAPVAPNFAANLYISSVAAIGEKYLVSVASREQPNKTFISTDEPSPDGLALVSVQYSSEIGKSKVTVKKGGETATLEFDQAALRSAAPAAGAPSALDPQAPRLRQGAAFPGQIPSIPGRAPAAPVTALPATPGQPRSPQVLPGPNSQPNPGGTDTRRRIRIINSRPAQ